MLNPNNPKDRKYMHKRLDHLLDRLSARRKKAIELDPDVRDKLTVAKIEFSV